MQNISIKLREKRVITFNRGKKERSPVEKGPFSRPHQGKKGKKRGETPKLPRKRECWKKLRQRLPGQKGEQRSHGQAAEREERGKKRGGGKDIVIADVYLW